MKKSDILTPVGLILGFGLMAYGMMSGGSILIFFDLPSIFITVGGSFSGVLIAYGLEDVKNMGKSLIQSFKESNISEKDMISQFSNLSKRARREGLLSLEEDISNLDDEFLKKGLQMVVDGIEPETIREILELETAEMENRHQRSASMFTTWGAYGPAFGMIGTLIGLVQMLQNMTDAASIASGMAVALLTTFYGSVLANVFCNPVGANLKQKSIKEASRREMMLEGILAIQSGVNPRIVEEKLLTYLKPGDRLDYMKNNSESVEGVAS